MLQDYTSASGGPQFKTMLVRTVDGYEQRNVDQWDKVEIYNLRFENLSQLQHDMLRALYEEKKGTFGVFDFRPPLASEARPAIFTNAEFRASFDAAGLSTVDFDVMMLVEEGAPLPEQFPADSNETLEIDGSDGGPVELAGASVSPTFGVFDFGMEKQSAISRRFLKRDRRIQEWEIDLAMITPSAFVYLREFFENRKGRAQTFLYRPHGEESATKVRFDSDKLEAEFDQRGVVTGKIGLIEVSSFGLPASEYWERETTTLCKLFTITASNGLMERLTDCTRAIVRGGETYAAAPLQTSQVQLRTGSGAPDNAEIEAAFGDEVDYEDLKAGIWSGARIETLVVNYLDADAQPARRHIGTVGEITVFENSFRVEYLSLTDRLRQPVGELTSQICRAEVGDERCRVDLTPFTFDAFVTGVSNQRLFSVSVSMVADYFTRGKITFESGANAGITLEILSSFGAALRLGLPAPRPIAPGDAVRLVAGCDGRLETCRDTFQNVINRQAEDEIPGNKRFFEFPK
jgi:uncharacterized phage protein (TIGR02218 family)